MTGERPDMTRDSYPEGCLDQPQTCIPHAGSRHHRHGRNLSKGWQDRAAGDCVTVSAPGRQPLQVNESEEMRAFGFSPDGAPFVIATSPGIAIYRRQDEGQ
jgi:hypothetical protein